jgi:uncharacterized protein involved in exopolysaccharide biosynthesis
LIVLGGLVLGGMLGGVWVLFRERLDSIRAFFAAAADQP